MKYRPPLGPLVAVRSQLCGRDRRGSLQVENVPFVFLSRRGAARRSVPSPSTTRCCSVAAPRTKVPLASRAAAHKGSCPRIGDEDGVRLRKLADTRRNRRAPWRRTETSVLRSPGLVINLSLRGASLCSASSGSVGLGFRSLS